MIHFLPSPLQGLFMGLLLVTNTLFWASLLFPAVLIKLLTPTGSSARDAMSRCAAAIAQRWAITNVVLSNLFQKIDWDIRVLADVNPKGKYLVCANHQTWNDIFALMCTFGGRAPFFKFFLKQQLIWVPVLGLAWWGLDYPFMRRSTPEQIKKNPALKGKDLETTRRACEKFRNQPVMILNFLEGTRFTPQKRENQKSPYQHLLRPKAGGFAFAMEAMGDKLDALMDITIAYPDGAVGFWEFLSGKVRRVIVEVRPLEIPSELAEGLQRGQYEASSEFRSRFQKWIAGLWREKDARLTELVGDTAVGV